MRARRARRSSTCATGSDRHEATESRRHPRALLGRRFRDSVAPAPASTAPGSSRRIRLALHGTVLSASPWRASADAPGRGAGPGSGPTTSIASRSVKPSIAIAITRSHERPCSAAVGCGCLPLPCARGPAVNVRNDGVPYSARSAAGGEIALARDAGITHATIASSSPETAAMPGVAQAMSSTIVTAPSPPSRQRPLWWGTLNFGR